MSNVNEQYHIDPHYNQNFVTDVIQCCVRECLTRAILREEKIEKTDQLLGNFFLKLVESTPDVWLHSHSVAELIRSLNEDRDTFMLFAGIDNMFRSRIAGAKLSIDDLIELTYVGLTKISNNVVVNQLVVDPEVINRWPDSDSVVKILKDNPFLLTIFVMHNYCQVLHVQEFVEEAMRAKNLNTKRKARDE